ncbi:MAG: DUF2117 domain-containing protein [Methanobacteriaceae archaeon]
MKVGIVVHGPYIIDSGYCIKIINQISELVGVKKEDLNCILGGTTGRTAVIDAGLENLIDISKKRLPSESVKYLKSIDCELIFLIHYGKSATTGHVFGLKVFQNSNNPPLIEIERPGEIDGSVISWNSKFNDLANNIANNLNLSIVNPNEIINKYSENNNTNNNNNNNSSNKNEIRRKIHGVSPNENILINGIVVGTSKDTKIALVANNNILTNIIGADFKSEFGDKLGKINLNKVIVKTGLLRKSNINGKVKYSENNRINTNNHINNMKNSSENSFKIGFIDNPLANIYDFKNKDVVIAIGDETAILASDILYRFDIPIIGVITGIVEKLVQKPHIHKDSVIIKVNSNNKTKTPNLNSKIVKVSKEIENNILNDNKTISNNDSIIDLTSLIVDIIENNNLNYKISNKIGN